MSAAPMPYITAFYAGCLGLLLAVLAFRIVLLRRKFRIGISDGGNAPLARAVRSHANSVEWGLIVALLLLIAEENRAAPLFLHACGITFIVARVVHAIGLSRSSSVSAGRAVGIVATLLLVVVLAVWDIWAFVRVMLVR